MAEQQTEKRFIVWIPGAGWARRGKASTLWKTPARANSKESASRFTREEAEQVAELWRETGRSLGLEMYLQAQVEEAAANG